MRYISGLAASLACLAATAAGSPIAPRQSSSPPSSPTATTVGVCPPSGSARAAPLMYNLYPAQPDQASAAVTVIEVEATATASTREQAMVVGGIPSAARTCTVIWVQGAADARDFAVAGSGLTSVLQLEGFPAAGVPVSYAAVAPFVASTGAARGRHADFTAWDQPQYGAANHTLGPFDCAQEMRFHLAIDRELAGQGHVHFQQDEQNGFFVEYSC
ncbi:hypothetical protein F4775DRAFT_578603 [Biscogniauxia sp. FL1348]|nr:hypothetical protein F4775DRAFT_578603 [Biscogniauxia sp. FL1348]